MGKRKTRIGVKCQKGLFRFINWRPLNDHDGAQWKVGRSPKCNRECNIHQKWGCLIGCDVIIVITFLGSVYNWLPFGHWESRTMWQGGVRRKKYSWVLQYPAEDIIFKFFLGFSRQKPENHNVDLLSMPFTFFKTLDNYVTFKSTHPTLSIWVLLLLILLSIIFFFKLSVSLIMLWMKFLTPGL